MGFSEILKKSFLENYSTGNIEVQDILFSILIALVISIWIFYFYRVITRNTFYSKGFNISLVAVALITCTIILTIQTSVVVSLGMVGALSIVRFRTAIKNPMDLAFLFWAISIGIICGAGQFIVAVILTIVLSIAIIMLDRIPVALKPQICIIQFIGEEKEYKKIGDLLKQHCGYYSEKTHSIKDNTTDVVYEIRCKESVELAKCLSEIEGVSSVSILKHDGEVTL